MYWLPCVIAVSLCLVCRPGAAAPASPGQRSFFVCTDYHCDVGETVTLTPRQWQAARDLFAADASPGEEREDIRRAIAFLETNVGAITGTSRDLGGNVAGAGQPGQLDCIAESRNTTTYLNLLFGAGLIRYHAIEPRQVRHPLIFNVHWSAVIRERDSGERFAVDSWFLDNRQPPAILPLDDWLSGRRSDNR